MLHVIVNLKVSLVSCWIMSELPSSFKVLSCTLQYGQRVVIAVKMDFLNLYVIKNEKKI